MRWSNFTAGVKLLFLLLSFYVFFFSKLLNSKIHQITLGGNFDFFFFHQSHVYKILKVVMYILINFAAKPFFTYIIEKWKKKNLNPSRRHWWVGDWKLFCLLDLKKEVKSTAGFRIGWQARVACFVNAWN